VGEMGRGGRGLCKVGVRGVKGVWGGVSDRCGGCVRWSMCHGVGK
jgi:hypothetical protein